MAISFINVDLEISSIEPLNTLHLEWTAKEGVFWEMEFMESEWHGGHFASYEIEPNVGIKNKYLEVHEFSAEEKIREFIIQIEQLSPAARKEWDSAIKRVMDVGYQSSNHCSALNVTYPVDLLQKLSELSIELAFTFYPETIVNEAKS